MSQQDLSTSRAPQKPAYDVYTVMLFIAFLALLGGCILLYLELKSYGTFPYWKATASAAARSASQWASTVGTVWSAHVIG